MTNKIWSFAYGLFCLGLFISILSFYVKAEKRVSYMEGRESVYNSFHDEAEQCYTTVIK